MEAFVNSGGNAILRTADGNIIASGIGSGLAGYGYSNSGFMGTSITVGSFGQVITRRSLLKMFSRQGVRAVRGGYVGRYGRIFVGRAGTSRVSLASQGSYTTIGDDKSRVNVRVITTKYSSSGKSVVVSTGDGSGAAGGASGTGGGSGGASSSGGASGGTSVVGGAVGGSSGGSGAASGGSSVSGGTVVGGTVTGATVLGSSRTRNTKGELSTYGTGISTWTLQGATTEGSKEIEVIGDFGGE